jgi:H+/Cl- antiporter ClcA
VVVNAPSGTTAPVPPAPAPADVLRSRQYIALLVLSALLGVPISAASYGFLVLVHYIQQWVYHDLPQALGWSDSPRWWPVPVLVVAGLIVGTAIRFLPGGGGHKPAEGFSTSMTRPIDVPGVFLVALVGLGLGVVLGPEAPLIALGGGLAVWASRLLRRELPERTTTIIAASGTFAAISTLLGSPIVGAFLLMEAVAVAGPMLAIVLIPGMLAAGIGSLIFIGLGEWTGLGPLSLTVPDLPGVGSPHVSEFGWAILIGLIAAPVGWGIRTIALAVQHIADRRQIVVTTCGGIVIALLAVVYDAATGHGTSAVLFSGQDALAPLLTNAETLTVGSLVLVFACKGLAYTVSLGSFRGGPIFPAVFLGAAGGVALSHLPGLGYIAGAAMGIGAMSMVMLRFPLTSILLPSLLLGADGINVMPLVIVAVVVAYVASAHLPDPIRPRPAPPQ